MKKNNKAAETNKGMTECEHQYTFKKEYLFTDVNMLLSKKICEKCGKEIVLSKRSKTQVIMFSSLMVVLLVLCETMLKKVLPDVSYVTKALVVVLLFCIILGFGLYYLMNRATYVTYTPTERSHRYRDAYEQARRENDERTRKKYEHAIEVREQKRMEKEQRKQAKEREKRPPEA